MFPKIETNDLQISGRWSSIFLQKVYSTLASAWSLRCKWLFYFWFDFLFNRICLYSVANTMVYLTNVNTRRCQGSLIVILNLTYRSSLTTANYLTFHISLHNVKFSLLSEHIIFAYKYKSSARQFHHSLNIMFCTFFIFSFFLYFYFYCQFWPNFSHAYISIYDLHFFMRDSIFKFSLQLFNILP